MSKFRKKPVVIDAVVFTDNSEDIVNVTNFMGDDAVVINYNDPDNPKLLVPTLEGNMYASVGDYIIKGVNGEFYPCKPDIFHKTYEEVE